MKRQRHAIVGSSAVIRPAALALQAAPAKQPSLDATPRSADSGPDGRVWARYIDSRLKQFGTR